MTTLDSFLYDFNQCKHSVSESITSDSVHGKNDYVPKVIENENPMNSFTKNKSILNQFIINPFDSSYPLAQKNTFTNSFAKDFNRFSIVKNSSLNDSKLAANKYLTSHDYDYNHSGSPYYSHHLVKKFEDEHSQIHNKSDLLKMNLSSVVNPNKLSLSSYNFTTDLADSRLVDSRHSSPSKIKNNDSYSFFDTLSQSKFPNVKQPIKESSTLKTSSDDLNVQESLHRVNQPYQPNKCSTQNASTQYNNYFAKVDSNFPSYLDRENYDEIKQTVDNNNFNFSTVNSPNKQYHYFDNSKKKIKDHSESRLPISKSVDNSSLQKKSFNTLKNIIKSNTHLSDSTTEYLDDENSNQRDTKPFLKRGTRNQVSYIPHNVPKYHYFKEDKNILSSQINLNKQIDVSDEDSKHRKNDSILKNSDSISHNENRSDSNIKSINELSPKLKHIANNKLLKNKKSTLLTPFNRDSNTLRKSIAPDHNIIPLNLKKNLTNTSNFHTLISPSNEADSTEETRYKSTTSSNDIRSKNSFFPDPTLSAESETKSFFSLKNTLSSNSTLRTNENVINDTDSYIHLDSIVNSKKKKKVSLPFNSNNSINIENDLCQDMFVKSIATNGNPDVVSPKMFKLPKPSAVLLGGPTGSYGEQKRKQLLYQGSSESICKSRSFLPKSPISSLANRDLEYLAYQAQAKIATVDEQISKLQKLQGELEKRQQELDDHKISWEKDTEHQRLSLAVERESQLLDIEQSKSFIKKIKKKLDGTITSNQKLQKENIRLEEENTRFRVTLAKIKEDFLTREERYKKLIDRLKNQIHILEKKNKCLLEAVDAVEKTAESLGNRSYFMKKSSLNHAKKPNSNTNSINRMTYHSSNSLSLSTPGDTLLDSKSIPKINKNRHKYVPHNSPKSSIDYLSEIDVDLSSSSSYNLTTDNSKDELCAKKDTPQDVCTKSLIALHHNIVSDKHEMNDTVTNEPEIHQKIVAITDVDEPDSQKHKCLIEEKNPLPLDEYSTLLKFNLEEKWHPFDLTLQELKNPNSLKLKAPILKKPDGRNESLFMDGHREITFSNGMKKVISPSGWIFNFYPNGDIRGSNNSSGYIYYFFDNDQIYNITTPDGVVFNRFDDGQIDCRFPNGTIQVRFPQNLLKQIDPDGTEHLQYYV